MPYSFRYGCAENQKDSAKVLRAVYSLRYQVYINEWEFEVPDDHPVGLEFDDYDDHAVHFYARCKSESKVIGTVRSILDSDLGFPIERHFQLSGPSLEIDRSCIAEVSRLAVSKEFRRRAIDQAFFEAGAFVPNQLPRYMDDGRDIRRHCEHELVRGLYQLVYRDSKERGLTHWYAVMAKGLSAILKRWGIEFVQIGEARDYHGVRAPYLASIKNLETVMAKKNPDFLAFLQAK
jgi:N-acyl amino acid synthase of PEP-CTERM/exosortase system